MSRIDVVFSLLLAKTDVSRYSDAKRSLTLCTNGRVVDERSQ